MFIFWISCFIWFIWFCSKSAESICLKIILPKQGHLHLKSRHVILKFYQFHEYDGHDDVEDGYSDRGHELDQGLYNGVNTPKLSL